MFDSTRRTTRKGRGSSLAKHVCSTCHFFQTAKERDKLGWCTNPQRQETSDVRILVRAGELRCRNDWGSDLWREKGSIDKVLDVVMHDSPPAHRKAPGEEADRLVAVARPSVTSVPMVSLADPNSGDSSETEIRQVTNDLNSELVRRARQQFRERRQTKGYAVDQSVSAELPAREALVISNDYVPPSGRETRPESPIRFADRDAPNAAFHNVPELEDLGEVPFRDREVARSLRRSDDYENVSIRHLADPESEPESTVIHSGPSARDSHYPFIEAEVARIEPVERELGHVESLREDRDWWPEEDALIVSDAQDRAYVSVDEEFDGWAPPTSDEPSSHAFPLWSDISVSCQTCRDFRPAGNGGRGWCNNKWAFKHRRMVDADECPCETSIGHWWLPADGVWQGELEVAALGQPTPLMDKYFGRPGGIELDEHFGERRRRRS